MTTPPDPDWISCPPGTLTGMQRQTRKAQRRQAIAPYVGGAAAGTLLFVLLFGLAGPLSRGPSPPGGGGTLAPLGDLACAEVVDLMRRHREGDLPEELSRRVAQHLRQCPDCAAHYQRTYVDNYGNMPVSVIMPRGYTWSPKSW